MALVCLCRGNFYWPPHTTILFCSIFLDKIVLDTLKSRYHRSAPLGMHMVQANVNPVFIKDYLGHADISTTEVYARADNEAKRAALEKATAHLDLPKASQWEQDAELIEWLSSLG